MAPQTTTPAIASFSTTRAQSMASIRKAMPWALSGLLGRVLIVALFRPPSSPPEHSSTR
jgi:hypothetical protein